MPILDACSPERPPISCSERFQPPSLPPGPASAIATAPRGWRRLEPGLLPSAPANRWEPGSNGSPRSGSSGEGWSPVPFPPPALRPRGRGRAVCPARRAVAARAYSALVSSRAKISTVLTARSPRGDEAVCPHRRLQAWPRALRCVHFCVRLPCEYRPFSASRAKSRYSHLRRLGAGAGFSGAEGREFESRRARHSSQVLSDG